MKVYRLELDGQGIYTIPKDNQELKNIILEMGAVHSDGFSHPSGTMDFDYDEVCGLDYRFACPDLEKFTAWFGEFIDKLLPFEEVKLYEVECPRVILGQSEKQCLYVTDEVTNKTEIVI